MAIISDMLVCNKLGAPYQLRKVALDDLRDDEILVKMVATGVCHTDFSCCNGTTPVPLPLVGGHEGAGIVEKLGSKVTNIQVNDHVLLSFSACEDCAQCRRGLPAYCANLWGENFAGTRSDGTKAYRDPVAGTEISSHFFGQSSFATRAIVRARCAIVVSPNLPLRTLCVLGCTLQTGAGTVINQLRPAPGSSLAVFGAGAVGMAAILAARTMSDVKIIAIDVLQSKLDIAAKMGAYTINSLEKEAVREIHALTGGFGAESALDTTGRPEVIQSMLQATGPGGIAASVGAAPMGVKMVIEPATWITRGVSYVGVHQGSSRPQEFIPRLVQLWSAGRLPVEDIITTYHHADIEKAKSDLHTGKCVKAVLTW